MASITSGDLADRDWLEALSAAIIHGPAVHYVKTNPHAVLAKLIENYNLNCYQQDICM
jgi:hypothetical protein